MDNNANNSVNCGKSASEFVDYTKFCIPIIHSNLLESFDHDSYSTATAKTLLSYDMLTVCSVTSVVIRWNVKFSLVLFMSETWAVYHQLFVLCYLFIYSLQT